MLRWFLGAFRWFEGTLRVDLCGPFGELRRRARGGAGPRRAPGSAFHGGTELATGVRGTG